MSVNMTAMSGPCICRRRAWIAAIVLGVLVVLTGCNKPAEPLDRLLAEAGALRETENFPEATIKLTAALAQDPKNIQARLLFAQIYIELGQGDAALGLLIRARQDGAAELVIAKPRAEAALIAQHYEDVIKYTDAPPADLSSPDRASFFAYRSSALEALGRNDEARAALEEGLSLDPSSLDVRIVATRRAIARGDFDVARHELANATQTVPRDRRLRQLRGDLAYAERDYPAAEQIYQKVVDSEPWNDFARSELAATQLAENKVSEMVATLDAVLQDPDLEDVPKSPMLYYLRAVAALRQQDYHAAQLNAESVVKVAPQFEPARLIAGASGYALHEYERAYYYLSLFVSQNPEDIRARKLLAATQLQLARPADAAKTLSPTRDKASEDSDLLRLIGVAAARSGDTATADKYLKAALDQQPDDWSLRAELGAADVASGDPKAAIENLEQVVKAHPEVTRPQLQLFVAFMQMKEYDKALAVAEQLSKSEPKAPTGQLLVAAVYMTQRNVAAGRVALLKAREIHHGDVSANLNLAKLALAEGKADEARRYYQDILDVNPQSSETYIALAELNLRVRGPQEAEAVLLKGIEANPTDPVITVALLRLQLARGEVQQVVAGGQQAQKKFPRNPALLDVIGHAELASGQREAALATFSNLVNIAPEAARAHSDLAEAYLSRFTPENPQWPAINEATEAVKLDPHDRTAQLVLSRALAAHGRFAEASKVVDGLKTTDPNKLEVIELDGLVARGLGQWADAVAAFTRAVALKDNALDRRRLADAQLRLGHTDDAGKTLLTWLSTHPEDTQTRQMWADICVKDGRLAEAGEQYAELVKRQPKSPIMQNNLAWILSQLGRADEALVHARVAVALSPESVDFLDTLGEILLRRGDPAEALDPFHKAWQQGPDHLGIGFHLSQALAAAGKKSEALLLLRQLLASKDPFDERAKAQDLLNQLGG
jgi:cellulose synthase operon protein C